MVVRRRPPPPDPPRLLVAYYRVSTQQQGRSGLGLDAQRAVVRAHAAAAGLTVLAEYTEVESGRHCRRPELAAAVALTRHRGAVLVVAKLDRLARDTRFLLSLVDGGVPVRFLDFPDLATDTSVGRMILTIMASVAEFESRRIGERIRAAWAARVARGDPGRPWAKGQRAGAKGWSVAAAEWRATVLPLVRHLRRKGWSYARVAAELNERRVTTYHGRPWRLANVHAVLHAHCRRATRPLAGTPPAGRKAPGPGEPSARASAPACRRRWR